MIQKKKFSDAIAANISVVGELIGTATITKNGLMSAQDKWMRQTYRNGVNGGYIRIKLTPDDPNFTDATYSNLLIDGTNSSGKNALIFLFYSFAGDGKVNIKILKEAGCLCYYDQNTKNVYIRVVSEHAYVGTVELRNSNTIAGLEVEAVGSIDVSSFTKIEPS